MGPDRHPDTPGKSEGPAVTDKDTPRQEGMHKARDLSLKCQEKEMLPTEGWISIPRADMRRTSHSRSREI